MNTRRIGTSVALVVLSLGAGSAVSAGDGDLLGIPTEPPPPPRVGALVGGEPVPSTTCEGNVSCDLLEAACDLVGGTYSGWESKDHGHTHGVCTWPWE